MVKAAPCSFATAVVSAGIIIWLFSDHQYRHTIDVQDHDLARYRQKEQVDASAPTATAQSVPSAKAQSHECLVRDATVEKDGSSFIRFKARYLASGGPLKVDVEAETMESDVPTPRYELASFDRVVRGELLDVVAGRFTEEQEQIIVQFGNKPEQSWKAGFGDPSGVAYMARVILIGSDNHEESYPFTVMTRAFPDKPFILGPEFYRLAMAAGCDVIQQQGSAGDVNISGNVSAGMGGQNAKGGDARIEGGTGGRGASGGTVNAGRGDYRAGDAGKNGNGGDLTMKGGDAK